jgi:tetratricopeptide (TPR) repeat protein
MNKIHRGPSLKKKGLKSDTEKGVYPVRLEHRFWMQAIVCLALAIGCIGYTQLAIAHSGFDPEIEEITEKLAKDPDKVDLLILRGQVYRSYGKFSESLQDLERAWLLDRENRTVLLERALTLSALGRNKEAESTLDYLLQKESDPKRVWALAERAAIRARTGQVELAIEDYSAILLLQPIGEIYLERGKLQESLGRLEEAAVGYQEGVATLGNPMFLKKHLIDIRIAQGKFHEALVLIDEQITRATVKTQWYLQRAEVLGQMGQGDAARKTYEKALSEANRILGKRSTALHLLARAKVLNALGKRAEALRDLRNVLQKSPGFGEAQKLLQQWGGA